MPPPFPHRTRLAGCVLMLLTLATPGRAQVLPAGAPRELGFDAARLDRAQELVRGLVATDSLPGAVVMVARRGRVVAAFAEGFADLEQGEAMRLDHIFRLASQSKILISAAALSLFEEDAFFLSDPVAGVLPEFATTSWLPGTGTPPRGGSLTVRDLLRHTCGYAYGGAQVPAYREAGLMTPGPEPDWSHSLTLREWGRRLAGVGRSVRAATRFDYGLCHDLLGLYLEELTSMPLDEVLRVRVLAPLGMEDTSFWLDGDRVGRLVNVYDMSSGNPVLGDTPERTPFRERPRALSGGGGWDNPIAYGGLVSTASDMLVFLQAILDGGAVNGRRILGRKTTDLFFENHLAGLSDPDSFWPGVGFGLGAAVVYDPARYGEPTSKGSLWWGGSLGTSFWIDPVEEIVGVVMVQVRPFGYAAIGDRVQRAVYAALIDAPARRP